MTTVDDVALVSVTLYNDTGADLRVRVGNDLNGPVLPPRREGVPAAGWDGNGYTGVVPAGGRLGVGYACPAVTDDGDEPGAGSDGPVSIELLGPAEETAGNPTTSDRVAAAVRSLGRATPPADAVPSETGVGPGGGPAHAGPGDEGDPMTRPDVPEPVAAWLDGVEWRIARAEQLTDATAEEAATSLDDCGGIDDAAALPGELDGDADALRAVGDRVDDLVTRAADTDPEPVVSALVAAAEGEMPTADRSTADSPTSSDPNAGDPTSNGGPR